jgi:hypothetical protein
MKPVEQRERPGDTLRDLSRELLLEALRDKDPADRILYQFAVKNLMLLASLAEDEAIRLASAQFLTRQFAPRPQIAPAGQVWGEQEQVAIRKIDEILVRRGLSEPQAMAFDTTREGSLEEVAGEADDESES